MPLLDHFHPPLSRTHPWRAAYGAWAAAIARGLNAGVLPAGYFACPILDRDGPIEVAAAALREIGPGEPVPDGAASWSPGPPGLSVAVEWPPADDVRIEVYSDDGDPRLAAAIELVGPGTKDRPRSREAFAAKCADYLRRGSGLVVVDPVTTRRADLAADLLAALGGAGGPTTPRPLSAVAYRAVVADEAGRLLAWPASLTLGESLPTLPLWLGADRVVPLDLGASHSAACDDLKIECRSSASP